MKTYLFALTYILAFSNIVNAQNRKLNKYLERSSQILQQELLTKIRTNRETDTESEEPLIYASYKLDGNRNVNIVTLFHQTFFFIDDKIFLGASNKTFQNRYGEFKHAETIFFKAFEYNQTGFMALSTHDEIYIYTFTKNQTSPNLVQTLSAPYSSDAIFLTNAGRLYLVSSTNRGEHLGFITVYKWLGSHFDVIEIIHTFGAVKMESFPYKLSEIVILLQSSPEGVKVHSSVYEFKNDKVRKIQHLNTKRPFHINVFLQNTIPYVLIYDELNNQTLYKWNAFEMVLVNSFTWKHKIDKTIVVYSNSIPLIVQPQLDKVLIFKPQNNDIKLYETRRYQTNCSVVLGINKGANESGNITFIVCLNEDNIINIYGMTFEAHDEMEREQEGALRKCFKNLELKVYDRTKKLNQMSNSLAEAQTADRAVLNSRKRQATINSFQDTNIESKIDELNIRLARIKPFVTLQGNASNRLVVNGKAIIRGNIETKKAEIRQLTFKELNGKIWSPEKWLQYNKAQVINGPVTINKINTKKLLANGDAAKLFESFLRNTVSPVMSGKAIIRNVFATKIFTKTINNIEIDNIYKNGELVTIKGKKSFNNISANKANISQINGSKTKDILATLTNFNSNPKLTFASHVIIDNLNVKSIDDIDWAEFESSLFKIGEDDTIQGNISVPKFEATELITKNLNGIKADHIMTKSTKQIINSSIEFDNIKASSIECGTINDVNPNKYVQIDQNGTVIKGHVQFTEMEVIQDLELVSKKGKSLFANQSGYIVGMNESDLSQHYLGKVVIDGNLYVKDFSVLSNTTIFVNGNEYTLDILKEYWNKNGDQIIPVHFKAKTVSTPHLKTKNLNKIPTENFALNSKGYEVKTPVVFENLTVEGNVMLSNDNNTSLNLKTLAAQGVKIKGKRYNIRGKKVFKNTLVVRKLEHQGLNDSTTSGGKALKSIVVRGNLIANIFAENINNISIKQLKENLVHLHHPQNLAGITYKHLAVENLQVKTVNGKSIEKYLDKLQKIFKNKKIGKVIVTGNATIQQVHDLKSINGHNMDELFEKRTKESLSGDVRFNGTVNIGNLKARIINNINFPNLTKRFFHKKSNQTVTGVYTFTNMKTVHLYAEDINGQNLSKLIDVSSKEHQQILAPKGIALRNIKLEKSVKAEKMVPCDINKSMNSIRSPETQEWAAVEINGKVTFLDENCDIVHILKKSVKKNEENVILAPVKIELNALTYRVKANGQLNSINLTELMEDVVLSESEQEQVITGHTVFKNSIDANVVTVLENADIPQANKISISELYKRIIRKDQVNNITIFGMKTFFGGLQSDRFLTKAIAGLKPENIVSLANLSKIPNALFDSIEVLDELNVRFINNYELDYILNNRLLTNSNVTQIANGIYFFDELEIVDNLETSTINDIEIDNIVFDIDEPKIISPKQFKQNVTIFGNVSLGFINNINITDAYNRAVLYGKNEVINGSVTILNPVRMEGNITTQSINGYPVQKIKEVMERTSSKVGEKEILNISEEVKTIIEDALPTVKHMPNEFMYIERSRDLQVNVQNAIDARVTIRNNYTLISILSEEPHESCNLPEGCKCLAQHIVDISPQLSVNDLIGKAQQRTYSYADDTMTIDLTTNSVSMSSQCRTNMTEEINEITIMTWSTASIGSTKGMSAIYPGLISGYISGVEFFTLRGVTYVVLARYYDPIADTHDLECTVMRFSNDKKNVSEIQKIPIRGAWTLYLSHTAQGIILVIGTLSKNSYTGIYRFNDESKQFVFLRSLSFGCTKAAGVVLGNDSLIILANKEAPLQVLKYHPKWDNYYHYQMFALDETVLGMSVFYSGGFGISDAYLCIVTAESYRIYSFQYIDGWKLESRGVIRGLKNLIPFELNDQLFLFAASTGESSLLTVVKHGAGET